MDYNTLNTLLQSLEIKDTKSIIINKKNNTTSLERDINLNVNSVMNLEMANPQRQNINQLNDDNLKLDTMNDKITQYNFVQTKNYNQNLDINFKK
jgi:hypothetical protein